MDTINFGTPIDAEDTQLSTKLQMELLKELISGSGRKITLAKIVDKATEVLGASACSLFLVEPDGQSVVMRAGTGYAEQFVDSATSKVLPSHEVKDLPDLPIEQRLGLTGWVASTGKPFLASSPEELRAHPHWSGRYDEKQVSGGPLLIQSFLAVPLRGLHYRVIGVMKAEREASLPASAPFSIQDQVALETLGQVASRAIEYSDMALRGEPNAAAISWTREILTEAATSGEELDSFLNTVVNTVAVAFGADACTVFLIDEGGKTVTQRAGCGPLALRKGIRAYELPSVEEIAAAESRGKRVGLTAWIAATGNPFNAPSYEELRAHRHHRGEFDPLNYEKDEFCGAFLGVPLRLGGTTIGVFKVENTGYRGQPPCKPFSEQDQRRFELLALDVALAIKKLQGQSRPRYRVITEALPTIYDILRGSFELHELEQIVVKRTQELFNARACALFLKEGHKLVQAAAEGWAAKGPPSREYELVPPERALTVWIATTGQKFTAKSNLELKMHPWHQGKFDRWNFEKKEKCESLMGVPLLVGDKCIGVLKVETKIDRNTGDFTYFNEQDELVFELLVNSAAIAIENARLLESQRLAEQILSQPQMLLLDLHSFAKDHENAVDILKQTADLLRGKRPDIATIVDRYAALLQPGFPVQVMAAVPGLITQYRDFLDRSEEISILYQAFVDALEIKSLADIAKLCSSRDALSAPQLLEPQFFLAEAVTILVDMYGQVAASLRGEGIDVARGSSLDRVIAHLTEAQRKAKKLSPPERDILCRTIDQWLKIVRRARGDFHRVENPYVAGPPIDPEAGSPFFGRQDIFDWVAENLHGATQKNILVLHGERRMGKTSILLQLERGELGEPLRKGNGRPLCPVYVDMQALTDIGTHLFLNGIAKRIGQHPAVQGKVSVPSDADFEKAPYAIFRGFMEEVSNLLDPALLVLMFDEFEALEKRVADHKVDADIYEQLRHQMQFRPNITFILAGTRQLEELSADYKGIVFTVALHREVGFMDEADARDLVQQPVAGQVVYEDAAVDELVRTTHGHPYLLQWLCQWLISEMNRRAESNFISLGDINAAIEYFIRQRSGHLKYIWDESTWAEQAVISALADMVEVGQPHVAQAELIDHLRRSPSEIADAIHRLVRRRLIEEVSTQVVAAGEALYRPTMTLFCQWISHHFPLSKMLKGEN